MIRSYSVARWREGAITALEDQLSVEEPLSIHLDGKPFATLMRSPGRDTDLVRGFLFSEGLLESEKDLASVSLHEGEAHVVLAPQAKSRVGWSRSVAVSSSCGVCGRAVIAEMLERIPTLAAWEVDAATVTGLAEAIGPHQTEFARTGGAHAAALFDSAGQLRAIAEDVGRHNALDKLIGSALGRGELPLQESILIMTSRASFDIVQKAAMAGIPVVGAMGAASSLAVDLARAVGLRLYWFVRPGRAVTWESGASA